MTIASRSLASSAHDPDFLLPVQLRSPMMAASGLRLLFAAGLTARSVAPSCEFPTTGTLNANFTCG